MDKKDIYEHLAKIYLDASNKTSKRKTKKQTYFKFKKPFLIATSILGFILFTYINVSYKNNSLKKHEIALVLQPDVAKINFNFDPAKKEIYSIDLNKLNLSRFKALGFSVRKGNYRDKLSLRIEFINHFREKSEVYLKDISHKWQNYRIPFSEFKNITNWTQMQNLSFVVEEWNAKEKNDVVFIDNIRFLDK